MGHNSGIAWHEDWVEALSLLFLVIGFVISILLRSAILSYVSVILSGLVAGRFFYSRRHHQPILPVILITIGFLLGYIIGAVWVSRFWILVFFIFFFWLSYQLHVRKIFVIFKSRNFIK